MKTKLPHATSVFLIVFLFIGASQVFAQTIAFTDPPMPAPNQNNGSTNVWPRACASSAFNDYFVTVNWVGTANTNNEFILELSNNSGSFSAPTELDRVTDKNSNFEFFMNFVLPTNTRGNGYKMRVRSTSPAATSTASDAYAMYYLSFNSNLHISPNGDGTTPGNVQACDGSSVTLTVDNLPASSINTYQYAWYRSGTRLTETGPSIQTTGTGDYYVYVDYGDCTGSNPESNHIVINIGTSVDISINTPSNTAFCAGETAETLQANVQNSNYSYTWYKDGVQVQAKQIGGFTYAINTNDATFAGSYTVKVEGPGICTETSSPINITNAGAYGKGIHIDSAGTIDDLYIDHNAITGKAIEIRLAGAFTDKAINVTSASATSGGGIYIDMSKSFYSGDVATFIVNASNATGRCLLLQNDGSGSALSIDQNTPGSDA
ncbi:hypothetical protein LCGC14_1555790, partial [marine sediment metagenome]